MTETLHTRAPGRESGRSAVARLVCVRPEVFAATVWGTRPLLSRAADLPQPFDDLLDADAVDTLITTRGLRTPFLRVAKDGRTLSAADFTAGGGVGASVADQVSDEKLARLFIDGATIVLQALHRTWEPLMRFGQQISDELGHPTQINAYVTPPQARGFDDHYDVHDVFVLQTGGEKRWRIHEPVLQWPLRDQPWTERRDAVAAAAAEPAVIDTVLRPGDCLYLPRGYLHAATALGGVSTHVTIGVHAYTRHHLAEQLATDALRLAADDPAFREALPLGAEGVADEMAAVRTLLAAALERVDTAAVEQRVRADARSGGRAEPIGPLEQLRAVDALTEDDVVRLRHHLQATVEQRDGGVALASRAGRFAISADEHEAVARLLHGPVLARDLGVDLARRLMRASIVVQAD